MTQRSGCRSLGLQPLMHGDLSGGRGEGGRPGVSRVHAWELGDLVAWLTLFCRVRFGDEARAGWRGRR